jgi:DNA repair protein RecO (recombination protein O)
MIRLYRDHAVVLRTHKLGESDRIITLLSRRHGKVRAVAKGVRRTSSRFGARLEPFSLVDIQLHAGRNLHTVNQVESIENFAGRIAADYPAYTSGAVMLETVDRLTDEVVEPSERQFLLLVGALRALADRDVPSGLVLDSFLLRSLAQAGWALSLRRCAVCGAEGPHHALSIAAGGMVCSQCRGAGAVSVRQAASDLLVYLLAGAWDDAVGSEESVRREVSGIVSAWVQWHLERSLRSLPLVERG